MTAPTQLISYHEVKFLEAEALCRLGGRVDEAKAALKDAVIAAFANLENTVADAARNWLAGKPISWVTPSPKPILIMK